MSPLIDSGYAWRRLLASVIISTMGGIGMWALAVAMPAVQIDLGVTRADISFAYSMNMIGFVAGGVLLGRLVDRRGIVFTSTVSAFGLAAGFALATATSSLVMFAAAQALVDQRGGRVRHGRADAEKFLQRLRGIDGHRRPLGRGNRHPITLEPTHRIALHEAPRRQHARRHGRGLRADELRVRHVPRCRP